MLCTQEFLFFPDTCGTFMLARKEVKTNFKRLILLRICSLTTEE